MFADPAPPLECWEAMLQVYQALSADPAHPWLFRGAQFDQLQTSLERAAQEFGVPPARLPQIERGLVRQFARHYHQYASPIPEPDNYLEWFSIMGHYGAPTRLLDFTYSFYVALFFALEAPFAFDPNGCYTATVWAVDLSTLEAQLPGVLGGRRRQAWRQDPTITRYATFNALFMRARPRPLVAAVSPYRRNQRLTIQQGLFLCPGDLRLPFMDNLRAVLPETNSAAFRQLTLKLTRAERSQILTRLNHMNMNHATLFPGLEGMARSLRLRLASDETLLYAPDSPEPLEP